MKVGFLFNHDALHQIRHTAPVIAEIVRFPGVQAVVLTSSPEQEAHVRALLGPAAEQVHFVRLRIGRLAEALDRTLRFVAPFRRVATLRENLPAFAALDVLVVPETTSLLLRDRFGLTGPRFVWIPHGAGDRSVGFRPVMRGFDLVLLSGAKVRDRMLAAGLIKLENHAIIGYPKFDTIDEAPPTRLFANDRPTVLYNPHFDPKLSSWYTMGKDVLAWFAQQSRVNLIVAPHVMLAKRRLHASVEHRIVHWRRDIERQYRDLPHIHVDMGSEASVDMTYTRAADIYLGDASSQIYEWIARPRPAIFLNAAGVAWAADPDFAHWRLGEVIDEVAALPAALDGAVTDPDRHRAAQEAAFAATFSRTDQPASRRAAAAIVERFGAA
ncbi:hypothetical protein [Sphingomonas jeddahensis]|uniref:CDP-Glycerol:Poly(Glycerophosphate) glycerophosphotransferase n=1 Tax=Sphingomonas jeddahensis TaxID=1915074 RepID=A0A1V2EX74_9SPHN|nr:hypothetical protein [Sphingomonas jeddahensis]ONF97097.1 hypothetical protein SPHI_05340 [Sphingomonas jeddahensis]